MTSSLRGVTNRVNCARRIEVVGPLAAAIPGLKALGCFTEIIAFRTRVFVPSTNARGVLTAILACRGEGGRGIER